VFRVTVSTTNNIQEKMDELRERIRTLSERTSAEITFTLAEAITDIFHEEGMPGGRGPRWPELSDKTLNRRRLQFGQFHLKNLEGDIELPYFTPLIRSGQMRGDIFENIRIVKSSKGWSAVIAPTLERFYYHQVGAPSVNLPARPMLPTGQYGRELFEDIVESVILPAIRGKG